jgi:hypothetical protein
MLLAAGLIDLRDAPLIGGFLPGDVVPRTSQSGAAASETPSLLLTPGPRATPTRGAARGTPPPQFGFKGGDPVLARRGAEGWVSEEFLRLP